MNKNKKQKIKNLNISINSLFDKFQKLQWQDKAVIIIISLIFLTQIFILSGLHQLPGPIYGGDVYFHQGIIHHMDNTLEPWKDPIFKEEYVFYPSFMHFIIAVLSKITTLSIYHMTIYFTALMTLTSMIIMYLLGSKYMSKTTGLILSILIGSAISFTHASNFARLIMISLSLLSYYYAKSNKGYMMAGIIYSIGSVQSILIVVGIPIFVVLVILERLIISKQHIKQELKKVIKDNLYFILGFLIVLPIFLLFYWGPVLFIYKLHTINPWHEYTASGVQSLNFGIIFNIIKNSIFNFSSIIKGIFSISTIIGIIYSYKSKKYLPLIIFFTGILATIHPLITEPLLGMSFGWYRFPVYVSIANIFLISVGFTVLLNLKFKKEKIELNKLYKPVLIILVGLILFTNVIQGIDAFKTNKWTQIGFTESPTIDTMQEVGDWLKENDPDSVVLSLHPESSFALFGVSGIKQVTSRRTHANLFVDINKRNADAAIMLFSENTEKVKELIKKYDVKYLFIEPYGIQAQQECYKNMEQMKQEGYGDLSMNCFITDRKYEDYLIENGLNYVDVYARLDPAVADGPRFDLSAIIPNPNLINSYLQNHTIQIINKNQIILLKIQDEK